MIERPLLLECTRMVATAWTGRAQTGIDRVCQAYLRHFAPRAQAVIQHRGVARILTPRHSDELFALLAGAAGGARWQLARLASRALVHGAARADGRRALYLNVSHTDFDLPGHAAWLRQCRLRPVYLLHDLIPITHARYCRPHASRRHRGRVLQALRMAAGIIVNSEATAHELERFAGREALPLPPVAVAPLAGADLGRGARTGRAATHPYFLCVGTIEPRKNHLLLLEAWLRLIEQQGAAAPRLVIVGQWGAGSTAVRRMLERNPALAAHVALITRCSDHELNEWLAGAQALLMPTLAEGFGLPVVEALARGTPVIASDLPCFREIGQAIPCLLDPADCAAWVRVIGGFSAPGGERERQHALLPGFRPPRWDDHFAQVESWLRALAPHAARAVTDAGRTRATPWAGARPGPVRPAEARS